MSDLTGIVSHWSRLRGRPLALATVVRTSGSTYRKAGARMLIDENARTFGLVSGGCLEREVAQNAIHTLRSGRPALLTYDTRAILGCNGAIEILVEALVEDGEEHLLDAAEACLAERTTLVGTTVFKAASETSLSLGSYPVLAEDGRQFAGPRLPSELLSDGSAVLDAVQPIVRSYELSRGNALALLHAIRPTVRLVICGAGPDVVTLCTLAAQVGWDVTLISHPSQDAPEVPAQCHVQVAAADEIPSLFKPDARTAAVVMTHNYGRDLAYLAKLLPMSLPYLGLLGPRNRREKLLGDLGDAGVCLNSEMLSSLHSPAGLDLGADGPDEIALSILGEIKAVLSQRTGGFLRDRKGPIHTGNIMKNYGSAI